VIDRRRLRRLPALGSEDDADDLTRAIAAPRNDHDRVAPDREFAGLLRPVAVRVAEVIQSIDDLRGRERLSAPKLIRPGKNTRVRPLRFARKSGVDHLGEPGIEIDADGRQDDERDAGRDEEA